MCEEQLLDEIIQRLGAEVKGLYAKVAEGRVSAATVETLVRQRLWHFGAQVTGVLLQALDGQLAAHRPVHDRRTRTVVTLFGPVDVTRSRLKDGTYPLDDALGLIGRHAWTASVQEAVSLVSCECSFETTGDLLESLLGLSIRAPSVKALVEEAGRRAAPLVADAPPTASAAENPDLRGAAGQTLIVATDGCQAPQRDGWHEVKVATLYTQETRCRTAAGRGKVLRKEYLASLSDAEGFGRELWQRASTWEVERAKRVVVMGDGAPWIWNLAAEHFPGATEIVDFYHAVEHLWTAAEAVWGDRERSEATRGWVRHYRRRLKEGRVDLVIEALAAPRRVGLRPCRRRRRPWCVGTWNTSGRIASGCITTGIAAGNYRSGRGWWRARASLWCSRASSDRAAAGLRTVSPACCRSSSCGSTITGIASGRI